MLLELEAIGRVELRCKHLHGHHAVVVILFERERGMADRDAVQEWWLAGLVVVL